MKYVELVDGTRYELLECYGSKANHNGVQRDSLTFIMDSSVSTEELLNKFTPENCVNMTLDVVYEELDPETGKPKTNSTIFENYTIRLTTGTGYYQYAIPDDEHSTETNDRKVSYVKMAQSTLSERTILQQQAEIDDLIIAVLE